MERNANEQVSNSEVDLLSWVVCEALLGSALSAGEDRPAKTALAAEAADTAGILPAVKVSICMRSLAPQFITPFKTVDQRKLVLVGRGGAEEWGPG